MNDSNGFGTVEYDADINTKTDYSINHVFKFMTIQELKTPQHICETERSHLFTIKPLSVQNPRLTGYLLTGNRSNVFHVGSSTVWLFNCPEFFQFSIKLINASIMYQHTIKSL